MQRCGSKTRRQLVVVVPPTVKITEQSQFYGRNVACAYSDPVRIEGEDVFRRTIFTGIAPC